MAFTLQHKAVPTFMMRHLGPVVHHPLQLSLSVLRGLKQFGWMTAED
jgi:hypothetical protein